MEYLEFIKKLHECRGRITEAVTNHMAADAFEEALKAFDRQPFSLIDKREDPQLLLKDRQDLIKIAELELIKLRNGEIHVNDPYWKLHCSCTILMMISNVEGISFGDLQIYIDKSKN